jgi:SAM-dependent methyltransferase
MLDFVIRALERRRWLPKLVAPLRRLGLLTFAFRRYERYSARRTARPAAVATALPVPAAELLYQVAGSADSNWFLACGESVFSAITDLLRRRDVALTQLRSVLDFGCGCGRVLRWWNGVEGPTLHGCDYNSAMVAWCRVNLPFAHIQTNALTPPLGYDDASFDLVYAISVFTHLSADLQARWITELRRIVAPGGWLLVSTHGTNYLSALDSSERQRFERGELVVHYDEASGSNLCNAYHPHAFMRGEWSQGFVVVEHLPAGARPNVLQDLWLLRKS